MKKLFGLVVFLSIILFKIPVFADTPVLDGNTVYANGSSIVIQNRTDGVAGARITWTGGELNVTSDATIFGGGNIGSNYTNSNIKMIGGTVKTIYGGGNGNVSTSSKVTTSTIIIDGGTVNNAIYGGGRLSSMVTNSNIQMNSGTVNSLLGGGAASSGGINVGTYDTMSSSPNHTVNANVTVTGGVIGVLFGGGQGYSLVTKTNINVNGNPTIAYLVGGGSNGRTDEIFINVNGGNIEVLQGLNRGTIGNLDMTINNADINKLYILGDSLDSSVNGKIDATGNVTLKTIGGLINTLSAGTNNGIELVDTSNIDVSYALNTIGNLDSITNVFTNLEQLVPVVGPPVLDDVPQTGIEKQKPNIFLLIPFIIGIVVKLITFK